MQIQLPAETLVEILCWIRRIEMARQIEQLGDRFFCACALTRLHEKGKLSMGNLIFRRKGPDSATLTIGERKGIQIAQCTVPANIIDFYRIETNFAYPIVLNFFRQIRTLLVGVHFHIGCFPQHIPSIQPTVAMLLPLITSFHYIGISDSRSGLEWFDIFFHQEQAEFRAALLRATMLHINSICLANKQRIRHTLKWLFSKKDNENDDNGPRMLLVDADDEEGNIRGFVRTLKKDFLQATEPAMFFVMLLDATDEQSCFCIENGRTGEQLVARKVADKYGGSYSGAADEDAPMVVISRCPKAPNGEEEEIRKKSEEELANWSEEFHVAGRQIWVAAGIHGPVYS